MGGTGGSRVAALVAATLLALAVGGCAEQSPSRSTTAADGATADEPAAVERGRPRRARPRPRVRYVACDANIRVRRRTTSCGFAQNAFFAYWRARDGGDDRDEIEVYSPVTGRSSWLTCREATTTVSCRGAGRVGVRFPVAALDVYDGEQAAAYCASHATGPAGPGSGCEGLVAEEPEPPLDEAGLGEGGDGCDPNYEGACLDPGAYDYDCAGGSGDGPEYTGTVTVAGDDPFGLDRDGDGIGCE
ncbi:hypothetical protein [Patulibacter defluvii]|uniref:hypothetical protein n=1 Tax=Patulibacter defluvii TaxID=3095358 RepID=UPI002A74EB89|nr:hypothetical protein [Patulibacter sp. DM4]